MTSVEVLQSAERESIGLAADPEREGAERVERTERREPQAPRAGEGRLIALIFLLALVLRCVGVSRTAVIFNDGPIFIRLAELMGSGHWSEALSHAYHPLYSLLIHLTGFVVPDLESAAIALSVLSGSCAVLALYAFLRAAYDRTLAAVGATFLALHPYAVRFSADVQSDSVYLLFFLMAVALLYRALRSRSTSLAFSAGLASGFAYLTRPEGVGVAAVGLALVAAAWLRGSWSMRSLVGWTLALLAGLAIPALPYIATIRLLRGSWSISQKKSVLDLIGINTGSFEAAAQGGAENGLSLWLSIVLLLVLAAALVIGWRGLAAARRQAAFRARIGARALAGSAAGLVVCAALLAPVESLDFAAVFVSTLRPELLLLAAIGIGSRVRIGPQGRALFISAFAGAYAAVLLGLLIHYGYLSRRHALPPLCLLMGYAAMGAAVLARSARKLFAQLLPAAASSAAFRSPTAWLAGIVLLVALISLPKTWHDHRAEELAGRLAAEWLSEQSTATGRVAGNRSKLGYYARREWRPLRWEGALRNLPLLQSEGVRYVIVEQDALNADLAPIGPLAGDGHLVLRELFRAQAKGRQALVFELVEVRL